MGDGFYSFKLIIHQIQLDAASIFIESGMQEIATPVFLLKFLNFPMIMIKGNKKIDRDNIGSTNYMSGVFGNGSSTLFKYSSEKLNQELMQNPLKVLFADLDESKSKLKKIFGKCNISLDQFIEDEDKTYPNNVENFKRHCFKLFKDNQMVFGLMDLSISLVKRSITYLNQEISEKLEKNLIKEREIVQKDHNLFETFGKRKENQTLNKKHVDTSDLFYPKKTNKIQKYADIQVQTNDLPPNNNNIKNEISPRKTLPKAMNLINPSLKYMIEGNFCPPPMFLIKKKTNTQTSVADSQKPDYNSTNIPEFLQQNAIISNPKNHNIKKSIALQKENIIPNMDRKSSSIIDLKSTSIIDLLIEELLTLKNCKQQNFPLSPFKTKTKTPRTVQKSTHFERNSQKISIKDLEETPPKHISEDYSEDFDSMSLTPSQLKKSQNLKSAILTNYSQTNHEKTNQYTEEFESYTISETVNKLKLENKSLSDSNSQSNSQKKMVNCFICSAKIDASLAPEHAKICKISNLKYSQKKNDKLGRNSINSIKEEVEKEKEIPISDKNSFRKESNKSEEYIDDFHISAEEFERENF